MAGPRGTVPPDPPTFIGSPLVLCKPRVCWANGGTLQVEFYSVIGQSLPTSLQLFSLFVYLEFLPFCLCQTQLSSGAPLAGVPYICQISEIKFLLSSFFFSFCLSSSAGVGRTGTFITLDVMLQRISKEDSIDVFGFVRQMRYQRNFMVQTEVIFSCGLNG